MAYTTIDDPAQYFQTVLYTGNGSDDRDITLPGDKDMQPDLVWLKSRSTNNYNHFWTDSVRGVTKYIKSDANSAENTLSGSVKAFNSDGFRVGTEADVNNNTTTYVAWCWKEDTTAGFDIITYSGSSSSQDISHGLGVKPDWILNKIISTTGEWNVYHDSFAQGERIKLNSTGAKNTNNSIYDALPDSSVIHIGTSGDINTDGATHVFYAWRAVKGFSKFGSYTGNGNADGIFIYTGFKPAWVMTRQTNGTNHWHIHDNKRNTFNVVGKNLKADANNTEEDPSGGENSRDFLSNGFKFRNADHNNQAQSYIYMAFAESPFVNSNGVPTNAR
jgi:hypothetical protein